MEKNRQKSKSRSPVKKGDDNQNNKKQPFSRHTPKDVGKLKQNNSIYTATKGGVYISGDSIVSQNGNIRNDTTDVIARNRP